MYVNELCMSRAIELANLGLGNVSPNPLVGCVIEHNGIIIGEGYHMQYGGPHAEVNAIRSVVDPQYLPQSTAYVTLEPCCHYGKTPPCTGLILSGGIKKVVVALSDPNPLVGGHGIRLLREQGVEVIVGVMEKEARQLNKRFLSAFESKTPYVILKWAQTQDGYIAPLDPGMSRQISNTLSTQWVHKWRAEEDAILVGANTLLADNPRLSTREWSGKNPLRVTFDGNLSVPVTHHFFDQSQPTVIFNFVQSNKVGQVQYKKIDPDTALIPQILSGLHEMNIQSLLVEGGTKLHSLFIASNAWNEARVCVSDKKWGQGIKAPVLGHPFRDGFKLKGDEWFFIENLRV